MFGLYPTYESIGYPARFRDGEIFYRIVSTFGRYEYINLS